MAHPRKAPYAPAQCGCVGPHVDSTVVTRDEELEYQQRLLVHESAIQSRWPESHIEPDLTRIRMLVDLLGDPQRCAPVIHITGTNGKTSTARMMESLLRAFGLRPGVFTSPHLHSLSERIRVDGDAVDVVRLVDAFDQLVPYLDMVDAKLFAEGHSALTYFEVVTAVAFSVFADAPVDVMVLEVGLGGRWDATNVADGTVAVITPIALDHQRYLGSAVEEIAQEKAGIIKADATTIIAVQSPDVAQVLLRACAEAGSEVAREGIEFGVINREVAVGGQMLTLQGLGGTYDEIFLPLLGRHQAHNAAVALAGVEAFLGGGEQSLLVDTVRSGFADATSPGRLEVVKRAPTVIVDAAHNPAGAAALAAALEEDFGFGYLVGVVAVMGDKDFDGLLAELEATMHDIVLTVNSSTRSADVDDLARTAAGIFGDERVHVAQRLDEALALAVELVDDADPDQAGATGIIVTGSVVTVADARLLLGAP